MRICVCFLYSFIYLFVLIVYLLILEKLKRENSYAVYIFSSDTFATFSPKYFVIPFVYVVCFGFVFSRITFQKMKCKKLDETFLFTGNTWLFTVF